MKRTPKGIFFVVVLLIAALVYTSFFGVHSYYGDRCDTVIRGASEIRFGIDIRGGVDVTYGPADETIDATDAQINAIKTTIEQRLVAKNITDYECYADLTNDQVIVRFPWQSDEADYDASAAIQEIGETKMLSMYIGSETENVTDENGNAVYNEDGSTKVRPTGDLVLDGTGIKEAKAASQQDSTTGEIQYVVQLTLQGDAVEAFAEATAQQAGSGTISIWLDDTMLSDPSVNEAITDGVAVITSDGFETAADAQEFAANINAGALPFKVESKSVSTLAPTLGENALDAMVLAGVIAFILVAIYIISWYRLPGFVAVIALLGQVAGSLAFISGYFSVLESFTLTLPGIAGVLLSIGIGVDCNVITAERVREEMRNGKTIDGAIRAGSKNSFWAIFDGNITVLIVAIVLMGVFGPPSSLWSTLLTPFLWMFPTSTTGMVYSFGYTLFVGVLLNFVMGVALSRLMLRSVSRFKFLRNPWLYGGDRK